MADITSSDFQQLIEAQKETTKVAMIAGEVTESAIEAADARAAERQTVLQKENASAASAETEDSNKEEMRGKKTLEFLKNSSKFLGGIAKAGKEKVKSGLKGFAKFAFGALAVAALAFLNSPMFGKTIVLIKKMIPLLAELYDKYLHPIFVFLKEKFITAFEDIEKFLDGELTAFEALWNNKLVVGGLVAAFMPGVFLAPLKLAGGFALKQLKAGASSEAVTKFFASGAGKQLAASIGGAAIIAGVLMAVADGFKGIDMAEELGVSKASGFIGAALGGMGEGIEGAFNNMTKFALIGAGIGTLFFPGIGTLIGGGIGALIGGVLGFFGGARIAKAVDETVKFVGNMFDDMVKQLKKSFRKLGLNILKAVSFIPGLGKSFTERDKAELDAMNAKDDTAAEAKAAADEQRRNAKIRTIKLRNIKDKKAAIARIQEKEEERLIAAEEKFSKTDNDRMKNKTAKRRKKFEAQKKTNAERLKLLDQEKSQIETDIAQRSEKLKGDQSKANAQAAAVSQKSDTPNGSTQVVVKQGDITSSSPTTNNLVSGTTSIENIDRVFDKLTAIP